MTATDDTIVLAGDPDRRGFTVVVPDTPLRRLNYFDGKLLQADDLRLEQDYVRSLLALSIRGAGSGVVSGFELEQVSGDRLLARAGLAVAPSGRAVLLAADATLEVSRLIAASGDVAADVTAVAGGSATFGLCPPPSPAGPDVVVPTTALYLVTAAADEALCGEEERFGELCGEACLTETDRPMAVTAVRFLARRLSLSLPTSSSVALGSAHLRSRLASAYFAAERLAVPSLLSSAGLASSIWCGGADAVEGDEVPLGVLARAAGTTTFVDLWTARRELGEPPARRYWGGRVRMRPWDVFLAQVLHFQCQLAGLGPIGEAVGGDGGDACAPERAALAEAAKLLDELAGMLGKAEAAAFAERRHAVLGPLSGSSSGAASSSSSAIGALLDGGIVELPSAGYLPVDPTADIESQVRALLGEGVDLRVCAARADVLAHAFQEAQHLDRISLTVGLDDPTRRPEVDVLVPDGLVEETTLASGPAWSGMAELVPSRSTEKYVELSSKAMSSGMKLLYGGSTTERLSPEKGGLVAVEGAGVRLSAVARQGPSAVAGWQWAFAAFGAAGQDVDLPRLLLGAAGELGLDLAAVDGEVAVVPQSETPMVYWMGESASGDVVTANYEAALARSRKARILSQYQPLDPSRDVVIDEPDRRLLPDEDRPLALWFEVTTAASLTGAADGESVGASMRMAAYSRAKTSAVLLDLRLTGTLTVTDRYVARSGVGLGQAGMPETVVRATFDGFADPLVSGPGGEDRPPTAVRGLPVELTLTGSGEVVDLLVTTAGSTRVAYLWARRDGDDLVVEAGRALARPSRIETADADLQELDDRKFFRYLEVAEGWTHRVSSVGGLVGMVPLVSATIRRDDGALAPGTDGHDVGTAAIDVIAAELARPDRDPGFGAHARALLLDSTDVAVRTVRAAHDWVLFHHRRDRMCGTDAADRPVATRRYRLYHAVVDDPKALAAFDLLLGSSARTADELLADEEGIRASTRNLLKERGDLDYVGMRKSLGALALEAVGVAEFEIGTAMLVTSPAVLRAPFAGGDRGEALLFLAGGDAGTGDGDDVTLARARTYRSVLAGVLDAYDARGPELLVPLPDGLVSSGTDGAIVTVALRRPDQPEPEPAPEPAAEAGQVLLHFTDNQFKALLTEFGGDFSAATVPDIAVFAEQFGDTRTVEARFSGTSLTNAALVRTWYGDLPAPTGAVVLTAADAETVEAQEVVRAGAVVEALGGAAADVEAHGSMAGAEGNGALVVMIGDYGL